METPTPRKRPAPRGTAAYPRKRAVTACQTCRARRTKCDSQKPKCSFCLKTGAQCIQSPVDLSSFDPASLHIIERLGELEAGLHQAIRENNVGNTRLPSPPTAQREYPSHPDPDRSFLLPCQPEHLYDIGETERPRRPLPSIMKDSQQLTASPTYSNNSTTIDADLDGSTCKRLLDSFFRYVHVKNPILQEDKTRRMVNYVSMSGLDWSARSCLVLLTCALGANATPFGSSESVAPGTNAYMLSEAYFNAARKRLGPCLIDGGLLGAQCLLLAGIYLMHILQPYDAWRLFSQSLACCQSFEFDTPTTDPYGSPVAAYQSSDEAAKQSIYWSAWKSEREARAALEMRDFTASSDTLYPFFFPTPPVSSPDTGSPNEFQARERQGWYFYLTEISLHRLYRRVAMEALAETAKAGQAIYHVLADALPSKKSEIENWLQALPSPMSLATSPSEDDVCKFVLRGHLHNFYEMIHWPFVANYIFSDQADPQWASISPDFDEDSRLKQLAEAGLALHVERIQVNAPGFAHRHHGTWGMIRSCTRSALVLLKAAVMDSNSAGLNMPPDWLTAVREVIQLNRYWQGECPDSREHLAVLERAMELV